MPSIHFISASTSGHTDYVIDTLVHFLAENAPHISIERQKVETAKPDDLMRGDIVILGSGTWNFGGAEGQLNEHMHRFLFDAAKGIDLTGKRFGFISLGDDRYYFTTRCTEKFMHFLKSSHGTNALIPLIIVNEPYGQEERIAKWGEKIVKLFENTTPAPTSHIHTPAV